MQDKRRQQFPYHNIPVYRTFKNGCVKVVNQILEFGKTYIKIADGKVVEYHAVKNQDDASLISRNIPLEKEESIIMNRCELYAFLASYSNDFYSLDGEIYKYIQIPKEEEILSEIKAYIKDLREEELHDEDRGYLSSAISEYINNSLALLTIDEASSMGLCDNMLFPSGLLKISHSNTGYQIKLYDIQIISHDKYELKSYNMPIKNYDIYTDCSDPIAAEKSKMTIFLNSEVDEENISTHSHNVRVLSK